MGILPSAVRAMTPEETTLLVEGWNDAQAAQSGQIEPPTAEQVLDLVAKYG